jgi:ketosteroid isomerase-like protein
MDHAEATAFAQRWVDAWNSHDVEALLAHFADDVRFTSPVATRVVPDSGGVLVGKDAVREYWTAALSRVPDLHFTVVGVYAGVDHVVINYRNHLGGLVCEVLAFGDGLVTEGHGTYLSSDAAGVSGIAS